VGDLVDHRVEEVAVVGDQHQGAAVVAEPLLEPDHRVEVEVVGGLVEQQQVGAAHQRLGQVEAHPPAAEKSATGRSRSAALKPRPSISAAARARAA
jgi:hypothetical protein